MNANVEYGFQPGQVSVLKTLILHAIVQEVSEIVRCCDCKTTRKRSVIVGRNRLLWSLPWQSPMRRIGTPGTVPNQKFGRNHIHYVM